MSSIVPNYDEHRRLAYLAEKIFAIEYIANGDLQGALNDIYGKREAIFSLTVGLVENLNVLAMLRPQYRKIFNEKTFDYLKGLRNAIGHRYNIINIECSAVTLKTQLPKIKKILNENFPQSVNRGYAIFQSNLRYKDSLHNTQEQQINSKPKIETNQEIGIKL